MLNDEMKKNATFGIVMIMLMVVYFGQEFYWMCEAIKIWAGVSLSILAIVWSLRSIIAYLKGEIDQLVNGKKKEMERKEREKEKKRNKKMKENKVREKEVVVKKKSEDDSDDEA